MKILSTSWLALFVLVKCSPLQRRQIDFQDPNVVPLLRTAFRKDELKPTIAREGVKRLSILYGPFKVRPANDENDLSKESPVMSFSMDPSGTGWNILATDFPKDVTLLRANASIVLEDGTKADITNGFYLHHLLFFDMFKQFPAMVKCDDADVRRFPMSMFMAGSEDIGGGRFTTSDGKLNSGYYIDNPDTISILGDVVNLYNDTRQIFAKADIEYIPGKIPGMMDTSIHMLNVGQCEGQLGIFTASEEMKKFTLNGTAMEVAHDGYVITSRGHLHDGGQDIMVKINGKEICTSVAEYGGPGASRKSSDGTVWNTIREMTYCPGPLKVNKGDKLELEARYDLELHPARRQMGGEMAEEMALVTFIFASHDK